MAHSLQSLYKACKTDFLCTLNLLRMVYLNLQNLEFLLKGFCIIRSERGLLLKCIIAAVTGRCILGDTTTFINKDCRVLFGDISLCLSWVLPCAARDGEIWLI